MGKVILEKEIGGDGAKAGLYINDGMLEVKAGYPVVKVVDAVIAPLDPLKQKLKDLIPGDWDNPLVDAAFDEVKEQVVKLLSE